MTSIGPIARNVEDGAALMDVLLGRRPDEAGSFLEAARTRPPRLRIGLITESPVGQTDPEIAAAVIEAGQVLRGLGHTVEERPRVQGGLEEFLPIYQRMLAGIPVIFEGRLQPMTRWFRAEGRRHRVADLRHSQARLSALVHSAIGDCDVLLTPTTAALAPAVGEFAHLPPPEMFRAVSVLGAFTAACNLSGTPASTVPVGLSKSGLPIGVHIVGRPGADERVLALARELEASA
jgi:amidase